MESVTDRRPGKGIEKDKYILKEECWCEVDACFVHLPRAVKANVKQELETRVLTSKRPTPMAPRLPSVHPSFAMVRMGLLHPALLDVIQAALRREVTMQGLSEKEIPIFPNPNSNQGQFGPF